MVLKISIRRHLLRCALPVGFLSTDHLPWDHCQVLFKDGFACRKRPHFRFPVPYAPGIKRIQALALCFHLLAGAPGLADFAGEIRFSENCSFDLWWLGGRQRKAETDFEAGFVAVTSDEPCPTQTSSAHCFAGPYRESVHGPPEKDAPAAGGGGGCFVGL